MADFKLGNVFNNKLFSDPASFWQGSKKLGGKPPEAPKPYVPPGGVPGIATPGYVPTVLGVPVSQPKPGYKPPEPVTSIADDAKPKGGVDKSEQEKREIEWSGKTSAMKDYTKFLPQEQRLETLEELKRKFGDDKKPSEKKARLTWKEYDALSDSQRKAIDWNTRMFDSRKLDLKRAENKGSAVPDNEKGREYLKDVEALFGKSGGSHLYAPNTVALLKEIDFTAVGQDLDDYLSMERAISVKELKDFEIPEEDVEVYESMNRPGTMTSSGQLPSAEAPAATSQTRPSAAQGRYGLHAPGATPNEDIVPQANPRGMHPQAKAGSNKAFTEENFANLEMLAVQRSVAQIEEAMSDPDSFYWSIETALNPVTVTRKNIDEIPYGFGGNVRDEKLPMERMNPDGTVEKQWSYDRWYDYSWNALKNKDPNFTFENAEEFLTAYEFEPQQRQDWFNYIYNRAKDEEQYGEQIIVGQDGSPIQTRSPSEIVSFIEEFAKGKKR